MKYLTSLLFLSLILIFQSCEKVGCDDVFLGDFLLNETTKAMFPYEEDQSLVFRNQNDDEITFTNISWTEDNSAVAAFSDCNGATRNILYSGDFGSYRYRNDVFDIVMNYTMAYVSEGDPKSDNIVDLVSFSLVHPNDGFLANMSFVPFSRGATEFGDLEAYDPFQNLSLNGNLYDDGYMAETSNPDNLVDLWVSSDNGLIGFKDTDGNTWLFNRVE